MPKNSMTLEFGLVLCLGQVLWLRIHCVIYCMQMLFVLRTRAKRKGQRISILIEYRTEFGGSEEARECRLPEILLNFNRTQRVCVMRQVQVVVDVDVDVALPVNVPVLSPMTM